MNPFGPFRVTSLLLLLTIQVLVWHPDCISSQGWADEDDSEGMMNDVPRNRGVEADDLIISGDGENCYDDEDCSAYTDPSPTDDLITPRIVVVNQRPPYSPVEHGFKTSTVRPGYSVSPTACSDDEDCYEGSGDDDEEDDDDDKNRRPPSSTDRSHSSKPVITYSWQGLRTPSPTAFYARPAPTPFEDKSIMFTSKPIPPDPVIAETYSPKPRVTLPPRPTGPRVIIDVPKPERPHLHSREKEKSTTPPTVPSHHPRFHPTQVPASTTNTSVNKTSADRMALIIGAIALIFLVIVISASLVMKVRTGPQVPKSIDNRKNYQFVSGTPTLLLPNASASVTHLNVAGGPPLNTDFKPQQPQVPILPKKDLKEWYV